MGDRTAVILTVLSSHARQAEPLIEEQAEGYRDYEQDGVALTDFHFSEINFGNLHGLDELLAAGIPYTSTWGSGNAYEAGREVLRYDDSGEPITKELGEADDSPPAEELLKRLYQPEELAAYVSQWFDENTPLPWATQERNANLYRTRQLIGA